MCRCGFAGETGPRFIIPSEIKHPGSQEVSFIIIINKLKTTFAVTNASLNNN